MADEKKHPHPNDDYLTPTSASALPPVPPEVFPAQLKEQQSEEQGGTRGAKHTSARRR